MLDPFIPQQFNNTDFDVLYGNIDTPLSNPKYFTLDYNPSQLNALNLENILSGSATNSTNQPYNNYILRHTRPRYKGSKNTTDEFNSRNITNTLQIQSSQSIDLQPTILSKPSVEVSNNIILEFDWGGGSPPEIQDAGAMRIRQLLIVGDNKDEVAVVSNRDEGFFSMVEHLFPPNSTPEIIQYTTNSEIENARILQVGWASPSQAKYIMPVNMTQGVGNEFTAQQFDNETINIFASASLVENTSQGYNTGSLIDNNFIFNDISSSLNNGEEWYVSLYRDLRVPIIDNNNFQPSFEPGFYDNFNKEQGWEFPLQKNGIVKITSIEKNSGTISLKITPLKTNAIFSPSFGKGNLHGMLIWKSTQGDFIQFNDSTLSRMGKGGMTTSIPSKTIKENFEYITKTYGQNS